MKYLNGAEIAEYIMERQAKSVRNLRQEYGIHPRLAIICAKPEPVADRYMKLEQSYGEDILVDVAIYEVEQPQVLQTIRELNADPQTHGIMVQLPLPDPSQTDEILNAIMPKKDVAGLNEAAVLDPATPLAIDWLLAGYNVDLRAKQLVIVGHDQLFGRTLAGRWQASGYNVTITDKENADLAEITYQADVLVSAANVPGLIDAGMVKADAVIVDAGAAVGQNGLAGDVAPAVRALPRIAITSEKDGLEPLIICAVFDNVIHAARAAATT